VQHYLVLNDALYCHGANTIIEHFITHEEAEHVLNDYHARECGDHLSCMSTTQKKLHAGYYWPTLLKDCVKAI